MFHQTRQNIVDITEPQITFAISPYAMLTSCNHDLRITIIGLLNPTKASFKCNFIKLTVWVSFSLPSIPLILQAHIWLVSIKHQRGEEEVPLLIQVLSVVLSLDEVGFPPGSPRRLITDLLSTLEHPWNRLVWFINSSDLNEACVYFKYGSLMRE